jgi:hypothetical protein
VLNLEHCLDVLEHKPGALAGSTPLAQWRARGLWGAILSRFNWSEDRPAGHHHHVCP